MQYLELDLTEFLSGKLDTVEAEVTTGIKGLTKETADKLLFDIGNLRDHAEALLAAREKAAKAERANPVKWVNNLVKQWTKRLEMFVKNTLSDEAVEELQKAGFTALLAEQFLRNPAKTRPISNRRLRRKLPKARLRASIVAASP